MKKNLKEIAKVEKNLFYKLDSALDKIRKIGKSPKFDESIDLDIVLNLKDSQKKESIKGNILFPNKFGKDQKVIVFCEESEKERALEFGAVKAGLEELKEELLSGFSDFDIVLATPSTMPKIVQLGKVLGPRGLMPSPKNETIVTNLESSIKGFVGGKSTFRMAPNQGAIRAKVGKSSMSNEKISENIKTFIKVVISESKKLSSNPIKRVFLKTTMGYRLRLELSDII